MGQLETKQQPTSRRDYVQEIHDKHPETNGNYGFSILQDAYVKSVKGNEITIIPKGFTDEKTLYLGKIAKSGVFYLSETESSIDIYGNNIDSKEDPYKNIDPNPFQL